MFQVSALESTMKAVLDVTIEAIFETVLEIACETAFETILEMMYDSTVSEAPSNLPASGDLINDPFVGIDPFGTPVADDPFTLSTSFDGIFHQDIEQFSEDDPYAVVGLLALQDVFDLVQEEMLRDFIERADVDLNEDVDMLD